MPRRKAEDSGEGNGGGRSGDSKKQSAKEYAEARQKQDEAVVVGKDKTLEQQLKDAGYPDKEEQSKEIAEYTDGADKEAEKILEEAFPERKAVNVRVEAKQKFNEKFGIDPNRPDRAFHTQMAEGMEGEPTYKGRLTLKSVHGETHEDVSFVTIEGMPRGEEYLWYVMKIACPHAIRDKFEIDAENVTDPNLRDRYT